ncbi:hypothetical protein LTR66_002834 [Elasticomyces elasticus]|nr:hypothetical protein LTR66_002834 [Elasticomyces elasticus]
MYLRPVPDLHVHFKPLFYPFVAIMGIFDKLESLSHAGDNKKGLKQVNAALQKQGNDPQFLLYKARFLSGLKDKAGANAVIHAICTVQPSLILPEHILEVEILAKQNGYEPKHELAALRANGAKASRDREGFHQTFLRHAIQSGQWMDARATLLEMKKIKSSRAFHFAHIAVTQIVASMQHDELQERVALGLITDAAVSHT